MRSRVSILLAFALFAVLLVPAFAEAPAGQALYDSKCAMCHGKDGVAKPMAKGSANFNDPAWQKANDQAAIEKVLREGKGKMPKFDTKLKPEEITAVAAYVKTLK